MIVFIAQAHIHDVSNMLSTLENVLLGNITTITTPNAHSYDEQQLDYFVNPCERVKNREVWGFG